MKRLLDKSALITGSARGIVGRGFAEAYIREGATVAIADINLDAAKATADELGDAAYAVELDVSRQDSIDARHRVGGGPCWQAGHPDQQRRRCSMPPRRWISRLRLRRQYAVNVGGTLFAMQAAAKQMIAQGHGGKIINMASQAGRRGESLVLALLLDQGGGDFDDAIGRAEPDQTRHQRKRHRTRRRGR